MEKYHGIFGFVTLPLEILIKAKLQLWIFQDKKPRQMEIPHDFFLITAGNSNSFLFDPGISTCSFFNTPGKFHVHNTHPPPLFKFFLECLNAGQSSKVKAVVNLKLKLRLWTWQNLHLLNF